MLQHAEKYLYLPYIKGGGTDSMLWDLKLMVNAALSMRRVPIIKEMSTPIAHRLDNIKKHLSINWDKYIDLSKTKILKIEPGGVLRQISDTLRYVYEKDFDFNLYSKKQIRFINSEQVHDKENDQYPIICLLRNEDLLSLKKPIDSPNKLKFDKRGIIHYDPSFFIIFSPSKEVNDLTEIVLNHFGTNLSQANTISYMLYSFLPRYQRQDIQFFKNIGSYACMHVRYGHNAKMASKLIKQSSTLRESLSKTIEMVYGQSIRGLPMYIMCNIVEPNYFDFLKSKYDIYRYTDFEELRERFFERQVIDHDLLYLVEKNIMRHALIRIFPQRMEYAFIFRGEWCGYKTGFSKKNKKKGLLELLKDRTAD